MNMLVASAKEEDEARRASVTSVSGIEEYRQLSWRPACANIVKQQAARGQL